MSQSIKTLRKYLIQGGGTYEGEPLVGDAARLKGEGKFVLPGGDVYEGGWAAAKRVGEDFVEPDSDVHEWIRLGGEGCLVEGRVW